MAAPPRRIERTRWRRPRGDRWAAWLAGCALAALVPGCAFYHKDAVPAAELRERILPAFDLQPLAGELPPSTAADPERLPMPRPLESGKERTEFAELTTQPPAADCSLTLEEAVDLAFRSSPNLDLMRERIAQAQGGRQVAFADFLPQARLDFRHIASETPFILPTLPTSYLGNVAFGSQSDEVSMTELNVQWILWDFGRTSGRYGQAVTQVEIARLQYERARQMVAFNVTAAYFQVLQARALRIIAAEAVRRAESVLRDARNFLKRGTGIRNDVLRADVLLADMRLNAVKARTAEGIAVAALNQAIGINVSSPTQVIDRTAEPPFALGLANCLQMAVDNRDEFGVVLRAIRSARLGTGVAQADFLPKIKLGGVAAHLDGRAIPETDLAAGGVTIELALFEGGRRLGQLHTAEADVGAAIAQGKEICDRIAYEVQTAYLLIDDARQRITLARTAVRGATENLRVVLSLFEKGDATPTDVVDAELAMTRAQQDAATALYDYQTALARLAYAIGLPVLTDFSGSLAPCGEGVAGASHEQPIIPAP
jgi:outer membrane protein